MNRIALASLLLVLACDPNAAPPRESAQAPAELDHAPARPGESERGPGPDAAHPLPPPEAPPFTDGRAQFEAVFETLKQHYYDPALTEDELYRAATRGLLELADPSMGKWNALLTPAELAAMHADLRGEVVGIGVAIEFDEIAGHAAITQTIPGSPAERAGLAPGDRIVTVEGRALASLPDVVSRLRGEPDTSVALRVLRRTTLEDLTLVRARIDYENVRHAMLDEHTGYLRVESFSEGTADRAREAIAAMRGAERLVLDLRNNPGGAFDEAIGLVGVFAPNGTDVAHTRTREDGEETLRTSVEPATSIPLAILVNEETSSGAEIATEALRRSREAIVVGAPTLGKWSVQMLEELPNGYAMKYTVTLAYLPDGRTLNGTGVMPDVEVAMDPDELGRVICGTCELGPSLLGRDGALRTAVRLLR